MSSNKEGLKKPPNIVNNAFDASNHLTDSSSEKSVSPLWKQYTRGYIACHFHFTTTVGESFHSHDLCADFQVPTGPSEEEFFSTGPFKRFSREAEHGGLNKDWCKHLVFVSVREISEDGKDALSAPSLVRLRSLDDCPVRRRDFAESFPLLAEPLASVLDRELNPLSLPAWLGHTDVAQIQLPE